MTENGSFYVPFVLTLPGTKRRLHPLKAALSLAAIHLLLSASCGAIHRPLPRPLELPGPVLVLDPLVERGSSVDPSFLAGVERALIGAGVVVVPRGTAAMIEPFASETPGPRTLCRRSGVSCILPVWNRAVPQGLTMVWIRKDGPEIVSKRIEGASPDSDNVKEALTSLSDRSGWNITFNAPASSGGGILEELRTARADGAAAMRRGDFAGADVLLSKAGGLLDKTGGSVPVDQTLVLYAQGDLLGLKGSFSEAALRYDAADRLLESANASGSFLFLSGLNRRAALYAKAGRAPDAASVIERARALALALDLEDSPLGAMINAQLALTYATEGKAGPAAVAFQMARRTLKHRGLANTMLFLSVLDGLRWAYLALGDEARALETADEIRVVCKVLWINPALIPSKGGLSDAVILSSFRSGGELALTPEEERILSSYTGAYQYAWHPRWVQARTYEGRLLDTNLFLRDLFDMSKNDNTALSLLRGRLLRAPDPSGAGITFVDIGPAIANLFSPAATAASLAREFPAMRVVMLDLPEQVDIFRTIVHPAVRGAILALPNVYVVSGNGVEPLAPQLAEPARWLDRRLLPDELRGKPLIFRAANSIDIYESWAVNRAALSRIAVDYVESPVIYFFNRSILFKPAGLDRFHVVGVISPAGFDHQYETFNRLGDPPYTLSSAALGFQDERAGAPNVTAGGEVSRSCGLRPCP